ncbi:uncharacterized protein LOC127725207 [Mytilus californianus]|uniref:uncharacterized protein LOC127725207 n=1 Tax=Mytilus californianus TaxID=6549 RepID=UPI00224582AE|nr:uncharacterized protein LOC127725207 [Mytilus californianus]
MCTGDQAVEDSIDGTYVNDSVIVRVMKQKANCECRVSLINNTSNYSVLMRRYRGLGRVVPPTQNCGLAIDVHYHKVTGSERNLDPIKCRNGTKSREIGIEKNGVIKLKSKIISGNFTRGYCMQIYRKNGADGLNVKLKIQCDDPDKTTTKGYNREDQKLEVYIYIGAGAGGLLMMISILLILLCIRNRSTKKDKKKKKLRMTAMILILIMAN